VLSRETGHVRDYGTDPYSGYEDAASLFFPVTSRDDTIFPKKVIFGIEVDGLFKAYVQDDLVRGETVDDEVNGVSVSVFLSDIGVVEFVRSDTGAVVPHERDFWFAWFAFHPETLVYGR